MTFREQADALLAVAGELTGREDIITAARELSDICAEYDEVGARFEAKALEIKSLLVAA